MNYIASVVQVVPGDDFTVYAYFTDGSIRLVDIKPYIQKGGIFKQLEDETFFRQRLTVMNNTVAWDVTGTRDATKCIDLDPCVIYNRSPMVKDPLGAAE